MDNSALNRENILQALHTFDLQREGRWSRWEKEPQYQSVIIWEERRYPAKEIVRMVTGTAKEAQDEAIRKLGFTVVPKHTPLSNKAAANEMERPEETQFRIWKISPGRSGQEWRKFLEQNLIGIGFDEYWQGDLKQFETRQDLLSALDSQKYPTARGGVANQLWYIRQEIKEGDIIIAYGRKTIMGWGKVIGPYQYREADLQFPFPHRRPVEWDEGFESIPVAQLSTVLQEKLGRNVTLLELTQEEYTEIAAINVPKSVPEAFFSLEALSSYFKHRGYQFPKNLLATFITALQTKGFVILSGLSGTGKTKLAQILADLLPKSEEAIVVQDTIEGGSISLEVKPYMHKYAEIIIARVYWSMINAPSSLPSEGQQIEVTVSFDGQSQRCRFGYSERGAVHLNFRGKAREWFKENFAVGDILVLKPEFDEEQDKLIGFQLAKPPVSPARKYSYLPNHEFISVRPDWRDNKSLLGYYNPLTESYEDTAFLRFLLRTKDHYDKERTQALPHFVILDEMNLARVEYYFSDFLSVLESGRDETGYTREAIQLHNQDPEQTFGSSGLLIPESIKLPPNLYIIGTVNMDETTHAFSPKVLDRAFTIEFNEVDFDHYPPISGARVGETHNHQLKQNLLSGFQRAGRFTQIDKADIADIVPHGLDYRRHLQILNQALFDYDLHFGYRVFDEITQFMAVATRGDLFDKLEVAFDVAVLMKVLPKFNGPRNRLRQPLEQVIGWAKNPDKDISQDLAPQLKDAHHCRALLKQLPGDFVYPETARKAIRMLIRLHETGFASFA